jgi:hypothetical protein
MLWGCCSLFMEVLGVPLGVVYRWWEGNGMDMRRGFWIDSYFPFIQSTVRSIAGSKIVTVLSYASWKICATSQIFSVEKGRSQSLCQSRWLSNTSLNHFCPQFLVQIYSSCLCLQMLHGSLEWVQSPPHPWSWEGHCKEGVMGLPLLDLVTVGLFCSFANLTSYYSRWPSKTWLTPLSPKLDDIWLHVVVTTKSDGREEIGII